MGGCNFVKPMTPEETEWRMKLIIRHHSNMLLVHGIGLITVGIYGFILLADITWGIF